MLVSFKKIGGQYSRSRGETSAPVNLAEFVEETYLIKRQLFLFIRCPASRYHFTFELRVCGVAIDDGVRLIRKRPR
jgi:hypothetical protein